jgi:hypothetical protein
VKVVATRGGRRDVRVEGRGDSAQTRSLLLKLKEVLDGVGALRNESSLDVRNVGGEGVVDALESRPRDLTIAVVHLLAKRGAVD